MTSFRDLHVKGDPLLMINVWDAGIAKMMAALGAKALATSSAAHAFILGRPDGGTVTRDEALTHASEIAAATNLPVQGDFENGFGDDPETCAETVKLAAEAGLAGICIEDTMFPTGESYDHAVAVERIRAAAAAARTLPNDFVLTARADGMLAGTYGLGAAIDRIKDFDAAGADCLYVPMPRDLSGLEQIVAATAKPVNALVAGAFAQSSAAEFASIGVARLSIGSALARVVQKSIHEMGQAMLTGDFAALQHGLPSHLVDEMLRSTGPE